MISDSATANMKQGIPQSNVATLFSIQYRNQGVLLSSTMPLQTQYSVIRSQIAPIIVNAPLLNLHVITINGWCLILLHEIRIYPHKDGKSNEGGKYTFSLYFSFTGSQCNGISAAKVNQPSE